MNVVKRKLIYYLEIVLIYIKEMYVIYMMIFIFVFFFEYEVKLV